GGGRDDAGLRPVRRRVVRLLHATTCRAPRQRDLLPPLIGHAVMTTFALIGVGKLGEALLSGLLRSGRPQEQVIAAERHAGRAKEIAEVYGVETAAPADAVAKADVVLLAVKPQDMRTALRDI